MVRVRFARELRDISLAPPLPPLRLCFRFRKVRVASGLSLDAFHPSRYPRPLMPCAPDGVDVQHGDAEDRRSTSSQASPHSRSRRSPRFHDSIVSNSGNNDPKRSTFAGVGTPLALAMPISLVRGRQHSTGGRTRGDYFVEHRRDANNNNSVSAPPTACEQIARLSPAQDKKDLLINESANGNSKSSDRSGLRLLKFVKEVIDKRISSSAATS